MERIVRAGRDEEWLTLFTHTLNTYCLLSPGIQILRNSPSLNQVHSAAEEKDILWEAERLGLILCETTRRRNNPRIRLVSWKSKAEKGGSWGFRFLRAMEARLEWRGLF